MNLPGLCARTQLPMSAHEFVLFPVLFNLLLVIFFVAFLAFFLPAVSYSWPANRVGSIKVTPSYQGRRKRAFESMIRRFSSSFCRPRLVSRPLTFHSPAQNASVIRLIPRYTTSVSAPSHVNY